MPRFRSPAKNQQLEVTFVRHGHPQIGKDELSVEEPLEIRIQERSLAITMRTPGDDFELVRGFLLSEGVIRSKDDIQTIGYCPTAPIDARENIINITLRSGLNLDWDRLSRNVFSSTSCGLCGKASIEACHLNFAPIKTQTSVTFDTLLSLPERLRQHQHQFSKTGGLHAAGVFDPDGELVAVFEDVGRHNAVDKILGSQTDTETDLEDINGARILFVSGRVSFEIMQKALAGRFPIIAAVSAPTHLAVEFAKDSNQTLVGFLRHSSFNIYAHSERIRAQP